MTADTFAENGAVLWRHKKRGTIYEVLHDNATMQCSSEPVLDDEPVVVYRNVKTMAVWVRPVAEFYDGRFEQVQNAD